jgi:hypothetical protein
MGVTTVALLKLPAPAVAQHAPLQPLDPSILHGFLQLGRDEMAPP